MHVLPSDGFANHHACVFFIVDDAVAGIVQLDQVLIHDWARIEPLLRYIAVTFIVFASSDEQVRRL